MRHDEDGFERICRNCGRIFPTSITPLEKLDGCMSLEEFQNVRYGPATPVGLQSFLLPTIAQGVKCRDKFVDNGHLLKLRRYTDIVRICERLAIPKEYADEVMRQLLKDKKGLYSVYRPIEILEGLLTCQPLLHNRIPRLQNMTKQAKQIAKYRRENHELKKQLEEYRSLAVQEAANFTNVLSSTTSA